MIAGYPWYAWMILVLAVSGIGVIVGLQIWDAVKRHSGKDSK